MSWSTVDDVVAKVRRVWKDGTLLRRHASGEQFEPLTVSLRGPKASELGDRLDDVRLWIDRLEAGRRNGSRYDLEWADIGGRHFGRNRVPSRAVVASWEQAWALLGVAGDVATFDRLLGAVDDDAVRHWALAHPHRALALSADWPRVLAAYTWLDDHRDSGRYLREITAPGVDTKFAEGHRGVLAAMLGVSGTAPGFLSGLGLRSKPEFIRLRISPSLGLPAPLTELAVRADELVALDIAPATALILENEITYLSVDVPPGGVVIWGKGFEVDRVGRLPWLVDTRVRYWGDIDTHGFAILDRLRAWLPHTRSLLMDRETLLRHRDRWGVEQRPATSRLTRLSSDEEAVYSALVGDEFGTRVRLEQERIEWSWVQTRLPA